MRGFGEQLRDVRVRHRLTLRAVAEAANRSISSISDIEHSRRPPLAVDEIERVCDRLGIRNEMDGLLKACHVQGIFRAEVKSELEQDLFVTLQRSIQSRSIGDKDIQDLITELKQKLGDKEQRDGAGGAEKGVEQ